MGKPTSSGEPRQGSEQYVGHGASQRHYKDDRSLFKMSKWVGGY